MGPTERQTAREATGTWADRLGVRVAGAIRRVRGKISTRQIASVTADKLNHPVSRSKLVNLETGERHNVTLPEVIILSLALGVPPLALLLDGDPDDPVEIAPNITVTIAEARAWFVGEGYPAAVERALPDAALADSYWAEATRLALVRSHPMLVDDVISARRLTTEPGRAEHQRAIRSLHDTRMEMGQQNPPVEPPALPDEVAGDLDAYTTGRNPVADRARRNTDRVRADIAARLDLRTETTTDTTDTTAGETR